MTTIRWCAQDTPVGRVALAWKDDVIVAARMDHAMSRSTWETKWAPGDVTSHLFAYLTARFGPEVKREEAGERSAPARALTRYFRGDPTALDELPADPGGTGFQAAVWNALRRIPVGETRTYGQLAAEVGHPGSARAAGGAVGSNPIPLVIPCHRIVGADGRLTGFGGGVARKHWLLRHEGVALRDDTAQLALALAD
ncbi:MAG: methylated-DNA--[protein]-cysteine S-methyltransferase [bacterium]